MISSDKNKQISIVIMGDAEVGKSSLISRFTEDLFSESYLPTIGFEDITAQITINNENIQLNITDSAGQERFKKQKDYGNIQGAIIVYDVTNPDSFSSVEKYYLLLVLLESRRKKKKDEQMPILLIGNKIDNTYKRQITEEQGQQIAQELQMTYLETSAKESQNVKSMFQSLAQKSIDTLAKVDYNLKNPLFKILFIGDAQVGKSSIVQQKETGQFKDEYDTTIGLEFACLQMNVNKCNCRLQVWDSTGYDKFRSLTFAYYSGSAAFVIVYDVGNLQSFQNVPNFMNYVQNLKTQEAKYLLVGNKIDSGKREVTYDQGKSLADYYHIPFLEISAKNKEQVNSLFENIALQLVSEQASPQEELQPMKKEVQQQQIQKQGQWLHLFQKKETNSESFFFKILLVGDTETGKSSFVLQYADQYFSDSFLPTVGVDFKVCTLYLDGNNVKLRIWDTGGQEQYKTITRNYYNGAHAIAVFYDVGNNETFQRVPKYMKDINVYGNQQSQCFLIGTKIDQKNREVSYEQGKSLADSYSIPFYEISAKNYELVRACVEDMTRKLISLKQNK